MEKHFHSFKEKNEEHFKHVDKGIEVSEIQKGLIKYQINYLSSGLDGDDMTTYPLNRLIVIEHDLPKPQKKESKKSKPKKEKEPKKNELFFFAIVKNVQIKCSNCFIITDNRISRVDDPKCKDYTKIIPKSLLIGTGLLQIKTIRGQNHLIHLLTEAECFCYIPHDDQREHLNYKSTNIWNIPINKGIVLFIL